MKQRMHNPPFFYTAVLSFLCVVVVSVFMQEWWWLALPITLLFYVWTIEKPLLLFYFLIATIPWSTEYQFSGTLGTDFPDEPLMLLNAATALFLLVYNYKKIRQTAALHPIAVLLFLQLVWALLTVSTSTHPLLSIKYVAAKSWYLISFVLLPVVLLNTREKIKKGAFVLLVSMLLLVAITLVRHAAAGFTFATINNCLTPFFRNHVNYSALLVCMLPLLVLLFKPTTRLGKAALYVLLLISLLALYFSYARGAWLALLTGITAYGLLKKKALAPAFFGTVLLVTGTAFWLQQNNRYLNYAHNYNKTIFHTDFAEHIVATYELKDMSTAERFYRWVAGVRMVKAGWKTGFGPSTFYNNYRSYTVPAFKTWVSANSEHSTVHNYFLLLLVEQGVIGLLLFLLLLYLAFSTVQRLYHTTTAPFWKGALAAIGVILVMICTVNFLSDLIETDKVGSVFYLSLAVLLIAEKQIKKEGSELSTHIQGVA